MNIENAQVQMRKGILEFCILHIISRGEIYASDMLDELTSARIMVVEGTLYPLLTRLKNAGLLDYKWVESTSGPPRKYYMLTELGRNSLESLNETWQELSDSVMLIVNRAQAKGNGVAPTIQTAVDVQPAPVAPGEAITDVAVPTTPATDSPESASESVNIVMPESVPEPKQDQ
ncbi:PadR family transcriptional regulator [Fibrella sp. ES10-3-2-2]|uniref:PadR family transcriptional regulator n=1 Tax=Fibrivirga algicola TaxID=2950420 RepID=A0ABX0QKZ0_9BACT|nr:PadR family transcriptional regulator [Fibrivirga algicola]ARK12738.1 PadR family transcriptional regulator [Fibrella sp. ES10-3-2-2]NID12964.1 PadR family transcriptional regulator [Fibrivirga algicola]